MADIIKQINLGTPYELAVKYIRDTTAADDLDPTALHTWQDILSLINTAKLPLITVTTLPTASADTVGAIYLVADATSEAGAYVEWITVDKGASANPRYVWEKIGTTAADLTEYLKKDTEYVDAARSAGGHTHTVSGTVTIPSVSKTDKKLTVSRTTDVALSTSTKTVLTGLGTATTASAITGFSSHTTKTFVTGYGSPSSDTFLKGISVTTSKIKATATGTAAAANGTDTFVKSYPGATSKLVTTTFSKITSEPTFSAVVTSGVLSFSFSGGTYANVTAATGALSATGSGSTVMTGLGTATTATALTGVKISTQPTITLTWDASTGLDAVKAASAGTTATALTGLGTASTDTAIKALGTATTDTFVKSYPGATGTVLSSVTVQTQPVVTLSNTATSGIAFVESVTIGTTSASLANGAAALSGAHTHKVQVNS